ncbi:MAG: hypothetical protein HQK58_13510 [Deltaproteobacteria bacterium]|nr:hypothetical protein [Deltaproteobacteria bacterium]
MKNYSVIPIDPNASLFQDSSVAQIHSTENLPKEILDDFIQTQRPVGLLAQKKKYSGVVVSANGASVELEIEARPHFSRDENILIIFDHPALKPFRVMQTQFVRKSFGWFRFEGRDPRLDYRYELRTEIKVSLFQIPDSVLGFLVGRRLNILREIISTQEDNPTFCGCFDYIGPNSENSNNGGDDFSIHPVHGEIMTQEPKVSILKNISLGGIGILIPESAPPMPKGSAFFFELRLPTSVAKINIGLRILGIVRHSRPSPQEMTEINVAWARRLSDNILVNNLRTLVPIH